MRIGHGFDVHAFGEGDAIILGGVRIPYSRGLLAHSDGDVLLHALCDALLGAVGLGDLGRHFPDARAEFQGIDSRILVRRVMTLLQEHKFQVGNVDATLIAQAPKLASHVPAMIQHMVEDLHVMPRQINIKATTTEGLGYIGRGEGIAAHAVVLVYS